MFKRKFYLKINLKHILKNSFLIIPFCIIQSCSFFQPKTLMKDSYKGYETPHYTTSKQVGDIEIRHYQPRLVAEVKVTGSREKAANQGFMILAGYIFGKNTIDTKIAMTSPVQQENSEKIAMTSPVNQEETDEQNWIISFNMPNKYKLETLPKPKNDQIKFKMINSKEVVVIRFSGLWSDKKFAQKQEKLKEFIQENHLTIKGKPAISYYDDPFTFPWNRRNEIMQEVEHN